MHEGDRSTGYERPALVDYGDLARITADVSVFTGQARTTDLSFSPPAGSAGAVAGAGGGGGDGAPAGVLPGTLAAGTGGAPHGHGGAADTLGSGDSLGGVASGGGSGGGTGAGGAGSGSGGGALPFTGFVVATVGALGAGLAASGATLRRALRRER
jgi:hypothetical protein